MADEQLHATLDELLTVLRAESPRIKDKRAPDMTDPSFAAGWSNGWDACKQEVIKIINEGMFGQ